MFASGAITVISESKRVDSAKEMLHNSFATSLIDRGHVLWVEEWSGDGQRVETGNRNTMQSFEKKKGLQDLHSGRYAMSVEEKGSVSGWGIQYRDNIETQDTGTPDARTCFV